MSSFYFNKYLPRWRIVYLPRWRIVRVSACGTGGVGFEYEPGRALMFKRLVHFVHLLGAQHVRVREWSVVSGWLYKDRIVCVCNCLWLHAFVKKSCDLYRCYPLEIQLLSHILR